MELITIESGLIPTNGYLLIDETSNKAVIIDAPLDSLSRFSKLAATKGLTVEAIILTHSHWDHIGDAKALSTHFSAPIMANKDDEYRMTMPMKHTIIPIPVIIEPCSIDIPIIDLKKINVGSIELDFYCTPGHTEGGICVVVPEKEIVFTGDTLFAGSIGRTDLPGGSYETLLKSIKHVLMGLPDTYTVYPGHGAVTTIGEERLYNPFLS